MRVKPQIKDVQTFIDIVIRSSAVAGTTNFFRGHSKASFELVPSIYRDNLIPHEDKIYKETILRIPGEFSTYRSTIERLVKMQHYGVPTRLLDITSNPLVALYFAVYENKNEDGQVIYLKIPDKYLKFYDSDTISVLANIAKRPANFETENYSGLKIPDFNKLGQIKMLLHEIKEEKPYFKDIINPKHVEEVYAVKVKLDNPRILKQSGAFLIYGIYANKSMPAQVPNTWIYNYSVMKELIIPAKFKDNIMKELDLLGFSYSTLFPELEYQAKYIKELYLGISAP